MRLGIKRPLLLRDVSRGSRARIGGVRMIAGGVTVVAEKGD